MVMAFIAVAICDSYSYVGYKIKSLGEDEGVTVSYSYAEVFAFLLPAA
jgi:hypothetical protein